MEIDDQPGDVPLALASIIIPVYNDPEGIKACLAALERQIRRPDSFEVVIVDNASTPPLELNQDYSFSTRIVRCATPGSYAARNAGVAASRGALLAFTDADCRPEPDWLTQGCQRLTHDSRNIIGGEVTIAMPLDPSAVALYQGLAGFGQQDNVRHKKFAATANLFCTRAQFALVGPFDERLLSGGDREWCWRAAKAGFDLQYEPNAVVQTAPRTSLRDAIRQARRIVAGRTMLRSMNLAHIGDDAVAKQRNAWQSAIWILSSRRLTVWDRLRVLMAAIIIRGTAALETLRLATGAGAERR